MEIKIYTTEPCVNCKTTKEMMDFHKITYSEVPTHVLNDESILDDLRAKGFAQFPVISVNNWEDSWSGFQPDKIEKYSKLD